MKFTLVVKEEAIQDMADAFEWYETKRAGLGSEFLEEIERLCNRIEQAPEQYQLHRNQRVAVMHRFPFRVVYEIEKETIVVYAVYHDKRDPGGWLKG